MRELPHLLQESLQQRNERSLESYAFLQQAGEDIPGELERLERKLKRSLLCCAAVCLVLFLLVCLVSGRQQDIDTLVLRDAYDGEDREEEVRLAVSWADTVYEKDVLLQIPRKEISRQEAYTLFEACRSRIHAELFSDLIFGVRFGTEFFEFSVQRFTPSRLLYNLGSQIVFFNNL